MTQRTPRLDELTLSQVQREIASLNFEHAVVWGAPGTGKSTAVVHAALNAIERGVPAEHILLLSPTRGGADRARAAISSALDRAITLTPAHSWAAYAFDVIRHASAQGLIYTAGRAPKLLSGAEQDVIIADLLAGHQSAEVPELPWPEDVKPALATKAFRQEVRELFDRLSETGISPSELAQLGREHQIAQWAPAASLYQEYLDVRDLRMPEAYDPALIIRAAIQVLEDHPEFLAAERERRKLILVDDLQDCTPTQLQLLDLLASPASQVLLSFAPDSTTQGFRGASSRAAAELIGRWRQERQLVEFTLNTSWRMSAPIGELWEKAVQRVGAVAGSEHGRQLVYPSASETSEGEASVQVSVVTSEFLEHRLIGSKIMDAYILQALPFSRMAVIVRNAASIPPLAHALNQQGIPTRQSASVAVLSQQPLSWAILTLLRISTDSTFLTEEIATELLYCPLGAMDAVSLRRVRRALVRADPASQEPLRTALLEPGILATLGADAQGPRRLANMIAAGRASQEHGHGVLRTLWEIWEKADLAEKWQTQALLHGSEAAFANDNLDVMLILFSAAERFTEQLPGASPLQFFEYLNAQEVPMDSLAVRSEQREAVEVLTASAAAGRGWDWVAVAGVQEGTWPNTRLRGQVLRSADFAELIRTGTMGGNYAAKVREVIFDELTTFAVAISRAAHSLLVCAVDSEDAGPSSFLNLIDPREAQNPRTPISPPRTKNLRSLVAQLRKHGEEALRGREEARIEAYVEFASEEMREGILQEPLPESAIPETVQDAGTLLAYLAATAQSVEGAHPHSWWGVSPLSTDRDIIAEGQAVPVSPSKIEQALDSPLDWFIAAAGGEAARDFTRALGTLIHRIAEEHPQGSYATLLGELRTLWSELALPDNWSTHRDFDRAQEMVAKLAEYLNTAMSAQGRSLVGAEQDFAVEFDSPRPARLRGVVDRLERDSDGALVVIDFKTGATKPSKEKIMHHPQLAAYQVALEEGGFGQAEDHSGQSGGAALVQLGDGTKSLSVQTQNPLEGESWAYELVHEAIQTMSGRVFNAHHDAARSSGFGKACVAPWVCPLCQGKQVTE